MNAKAHKVREHCVLGMFSCWQVPTISPSGHLTLLRPPLGEEGAAEVGLLSQGETGQVWRVKWEVG